MNPEDMKAWINSASYEELLRKWRNEPAGSLWFQGEMGLYYQEVMIRKREALADGEHSQASKRIGWDG